MKNTNYLFITVIISTILLSCKSKISKSFDSKNYHIETVEGEDIELRNKLRSKRHRERNRHKNRNILNQISHYYPINKFQ